MRWIEEFDTGYLITKFQLHDLPVNVNSPSASDPGFNPYYNLCGSDQPWEEYNCEPDGQTTELTNEWNDLEARKRRSME